jgi:acylphosphatase
MRAHTHRYVNHRLLYTKKSDEGKTNTHSGNRLTGRDGVEEQEQSKSIAKVKEDTAGPGCRQKTIEIRISGKVQRVGMRNCIRTLAGRLNIRGEVMNMPDGSVLTIASGDPILLEKFVSMIYSCPRAVIRDLEIHDHSLILFQDFSIKRIE